MITFKTSSGLPTEIEYQNILGVALSLGFTLPSTVNQAKQNAFVKALKDAGIWTHLDALRVFKYADNLNFASIDWINPAATISTYFNSPTFDNAKGIGGDGVSSYVNTHINATVLSKFKINNASAFVYQGDTLTAAGGWGVYQAGNSFLQVSYAGGNLYPLVNSAALSFGGGHIALGLQLMQRISSTNSNFYQNGVLYNGVTPSVNIPNVEMGLLGRILSSGGADTFSIHRIALFGIGDGMTGLELTLKTITDNFYNS